MIALNALGGGTSEDRKVSIGSGNREAVGGLEKSV